MTQTTLDIFIKTRDAANNRSVWAIKQVLFDHGVKWSGQYREGGYAVVSEAPIPADCRRVIEAIHLPPTAIVRIKEG